MADFDIAKAAFSGPRMLMARPKVLFVWMAFNFVALGIYMALLFLLFGDLFKQLLDAALSSQTPDPQLFLQFIPRIGLLLLIAVPFGLIYTAVQRTAAARAILMPEDDASGYLRVGADEFRIIVVTFVVGLIRVCVQVAIAIVLGILLVILLGLTGGLRHPETVAALRPILNLLSYPVIIFIYLKFALATPQSLDSHSINIFGSWSLTQGSMWRMFGVYAIVFLVSLGIGLVVAAVIIGAVIAIGGGAVMSAMPLLKSNPVEGWRQLSGLIVPLTVVITIVSAIVTPLFTALWYCPPAEIYGVLSGRKEDVF